MAYGDSLGLTLPVVGVTAGATAAGLVDTALQAMIDRLETRVTPGGMDISADLTFQSGANYFGITDLHRLAFTSQSSPLSAVSYPSALYRVGGDLYFNDDVGNQVRLVSGGVLDISTTGGITGSGYGSGGVEVRWDSVNTKYKFKSGSGSDSYAAVECDDVLLRDGSGNAVRFGVPALAADYSLTLMAALPGSTSLMQVSSAGAVTASNTVADITTTSDYKTTATFKLCVHASAADYETADAHYSSSALGFVFDAASKFATFPVPLRTGDRIKAVDVTYERMAGAANRSLAIWKYDSAGSSSLVESLNFVPSAGLHVSNVDFAEATIGSGEIFLLVLGNGTDGNTDTVRGIVISYDHP